MDFLNRGMNEGVIRHVNLTVFKMMMEASLEQFFQRDILVRADMTYAQGLNEVVSILLNGIEEADYGKISQRKFMEMILTGEHTEKLSILKRDLQKNMGMILGKITR